MEKLEEAKKFFREVRAEMTKVTWSDRKQVMSGTIAVLALSAFISLFLALIDAGISGVLRLFLTNG
jgi:preprotein translocase subunit SecE